MSADNGIYIAQFKDGYRVAHCQAIENCYDDETRDLYRVLYFSRSEVLTLQQAYKKAREIYDEIMDGDLPVLEYGMSQIDFSEDDFPSLTPEEAERKLNEYWETGDNLVALRQAISEGPINVTAYYIWKYLQAEDIKSAQAEYQHDGDKLSDECFKKPIRNLLGCRLHLKKDCQHPFCKEKK
jgi:TPR repeat protein